MNRFSGGMLVVVSTVICAVLFQGQAQAEGNRYDLERKYARDISAAAAYMALFHDGLDREAVIIDVRDVDEYSAGHVKDAFSIPFPHVIGRPGDSDYVPQDPAVFVAAVIEAVEDRDTPILTMCRSGFRSVLAANLLAEAGYTRVMNIWEGYRGNYKTDTSGNLVDLDNDGVLGEGDRDGWSRFSGLPVSMEMEDELLFAPYTAYYSDNED